MSDRNQLVKEAFVRKVLSDDLPSVGLTLSPQSVGLTDEELVDMFETQVLSRHLDLHSRVMQKQGQSFYTIGSSGHEGTPLVRKHLIMTIWRFCIIVAVHLLSNAVRNCQDKRPYTTCCSHLRRAKKILFQAVVIKYWAVSRYLFLRKLAP